MGSDCCATEVVSKMSSVCFSLVFFAVIVTEKTNILLRYLHQQWDKKVPSCFLNVNVFVLLCCLRLIELIINHNQNIED